MRVIFGQAQRERVLKFIRPNSRVLEWGSGGSTLWFADRLPEGATLTSIDHHPGWHEKVKAHVGDRSNVRLLLRPPTGPMGENATEAEEDPRPLASYIHAVDGEKFDVIIVDGVARVACMENARQLLKSGGAIFLHDAHRPWYDEGKALFFEWGTVGSCYEYPGPLLWWGGLEEEQPKYSFGALPVVVCYYTTDSEYEAEAARLKASLDRLGMESELHPVASLGSWEKNCSFKARFIREQVQRLGRPVLWLDADAVVHQPPLLVAGADADFAIGKVQGWQFASGTLFFNDTHPARLLLDRWVELCDRAPEIWDQIHLDRAWEETVALHPLYTQWLPQAYIKIFDAPWEEKYRRTTQPVIEHFQASRRLKESINQKGTALAPAEPGSELKRARSACRPRRDFYDDRFVLRATPPAPDSWAATALPVAAGGAALEYSPNDRMSDATNPLVEYFEQNQGHVIHKWVHYFDAYHRHFQRFRGKDVVVVEIGLFEGGSLEMWRNYFGPEARIFGIDIDPNCQRFESFNTTILIGDQADPGFLASVRATVPKIDILIDDGGHTMTQQLTTFSELFHHVKDGGVYLAEDLHTSYWSAFGGGYRHSGSFIEFSKTLIDSIHAWHSRDPESFVVTELTKHVRALHYYDSMLFIEKDAVAKPYDRMTGRIASPATLERMRATNGRTVVEPLHQAAGTSATPADDNGSAKDDLYQQWIFNHQMREIDGQILAEHVQSLWPKHPKFAFVTICQAGEEVLLADTIDSLASQIFCDWHLAVVSPRPCPDSTFGELPVLSWHQVPETSPSAVNSIVEQTQADWVAIIPPGIRLSPTCLVKIADHGFLHSHWKAIYPDEDDISRHTGERSNPRFKPDFNLDMLRSTGYLDSLCFFDCQAIQAAGIRIAHGGAEVFDLSLQVLERFGEKAFGHVADVLCHTPIDHHRRRNDIAARAALADHFERGRIDAKVENGYLPGTYRTIFLHATTPLVSIVIPTKNKLEFLEPCINSILSLTTYPAFEILLVDNASDDPDVFAFYEALLMREPSRVRIVPYQAEFNYSAVCNLGAREAKGEYLLFLNNDTQVVQGEWLSRMMSHAQRVEVGITGPRLVFPESATIQHAGVVLGLDTIADHPFMGLTLSDPGYMGRALVDQNYSAVTGACQLIRRTLYDEVGGQDEERLKVSYSDIDLCLKVAERGYQIVWTPFATLVHHGSVTQKAEIADIEKHAKRAAGFRHERQIMLDRWLPKLASDPAYNPNLSLAYRDMRIEAQVPLNWDRAFHDRIRILGSPLQGGSGDFRIKLPFDALSRAGIAQCEYYYQPRGMTRVLSITELARLAPDVLVVHAAITDAEIEALANYRRYLPNLKIVFALDDLVTGVPEKNSLYRNFMRLFRDARQRLRKALTSCDRLVVSTPFLGEICQDLAREVVVVPNMIPAAPWTTLRPGPTLPRPDRKPRVGWVGAQQHHGDLELLHEVVRALANEVDWVFMGMCPTEIRGYVREFHDFVPFAEYPAKLAALDLDLALAPLEINDFNRAKSNLRLVEYGVMGWPVICTDIDPYRIDTPPVTHLPNEQAKWIDAIRDKIKDRVQLAAEGQRLREWVLERFILDNNLDRWAKSLFAAVDE